MSNKRLIVYKMEDFEGAKILQLQETSFDRSFKFTVTEIEKLTAHNVIFPPNSGLNGTRKDKSFFGMLSFYQSFFLVREGQTVEEAIAEVVEAYENNANQLIANIQEDVGGIRKAQEEYNH